MLSISVKAWNAGSAAALAYLSASTIGCNFYFSVSC